VRYQNLICQKVQYSAPFAAPARSLCIRSEHTNSGLADAVLFGCAAAVGYCAAMQKLLPQYSAFLLCASAVPASSILTLIASRLLLHDCTPVTLLQHQQQECSSSSTTNAGMSMASKSCMLVV
jgi:hypothetical protein